MAMGPILQDVGTARELREHFQVVIQQLLVPNSIHHLPLDEELQPSMLLPAEASQGHDLRGVLCGLHGDPLLVPD